MRRFGQVELDMASRRLRVGGSPVVLDRPCLAILALLIDQAGEDVHKDRLLETGWPGRVVHENSLAKAISRLRPALGADGDRLQTVHGYGYRLALGAGDAEAAQGEPAAARRWRMPVAVLAGLLVLAGAWTGGSKLIGQRELARGEPADIHGRVLWVDDHPENNRKEKRHLEDRKVAVYQVKTTEEALALLAMYEYRAVISDMNRGGKPLDGLTLVREMRRRGDATPFYLYTYVPSAAQHRLLTEAGGQGAAVKAEELYAAILPLFARTSFGSSQGKLRSSR